MKRLLLIVSLLTFSVIYSQTITEKKEHFEIQLDSVLYPYKSKSKDTLIVIQSKLQNERLTKAFNQVIFSSSDLVDNASAFGVSQNEEKTSVSVNTNFHLGGKARNQYFLKAGINANGSGSIFNLYSKNEWKNSIGVSVGLIWKFAAFTFSNENKEKLDYNYALRDIFIRDSIMKDLIYLDLYKYRELRLKYLNLLKLKIEDNKVIIDRLKKENGSDTIDKVKKSNNSRKIDSLLKIDILTEINSLLEKTKDKRDSLTKYYNGLKTKETFYEKLEINSKNSKELDFENYSEKNNAINDTIIIYLLNTFWNKSSNGYERVNNIIKDVAAEFDKKNINNTGYSFHWFDFNATFNNDSFSFSEKADNIKSDIKADFDAFDADKTDINKLNTALSFNYNYARNSFKGAFYFQGGLKFNSGSFLTSNLIYGTPKISNKDANGLFIIKDDIGKEAEQVVLGDFNSINQNLKYGSFSFYSVYFFGKKKIFGLNLGITHRYRITTPENTIYENNYSILFGPIFRKPKDDDDTGLTFGIDVGLDNALYIADAKDNFVARIRVGIPFKLFNINKAEKK